MHSLIDHPSALTSVIEDLSTHQVFYLDTEFESARGQSELCLLQLRAGTQTYLIDAVKLRELRALAAPLTASGVTWVMHGGQQDVALLVRELGVAEPPALFDTQLAWGLLTPEPSVSLAYLEYRMLGLRAAKTHQADDWKRRPLSASQLEYAAGDVEYLPTLHEQLRDKLASKGRQAQLQAACHELLWANSASPEPMRLESFRNAWQLEPKGQAGLRFLIEWYNALSPAARARAPESRTLLSIASRAPTTLDELSRIKGVSREFLRDLGQAWLTKLLAAQRNAATGDFQPLEPPPYATYPRITHEAALQVLRAELCRRIEIAPELLLPNRLLPRIADALASDGLSALAPSALSQQLSDWRLSLIEPELEAALRLLGGLFETS